MNQMKALRTMLLEKKPLKDYAKQQATKAIKLHKVIMPDDKTPYNAIANNPIDDDAASHNPMHREKRNVYINGKRTSLSIEAYIWAEIDQLSARENITIDEFCSKIDEYRDKRFSLPSVIRYISVLINANRSGAPVGAIQGASHGEMTETPMTFPSPFYMALEKIRNLSPDQDS